MTALTEGDKRHLTELARLALMRFLANGEVINPGSLSEAELARRAAFVTLRDRGSGDLLGCRGESHARRPLAESVIRHAIAAATDDPRFPPLAYEDLARTDIQISALSPLERIEPHALVPGRDGVLIVKGRASGILLPQVAMRMGHVTPEAFLQAVCRKANLPENAWAHPDAHLFRFEADSWGEAGEDV